MHAVRTVPWPLAALLATLLATSPAWADAGAEAGAGRDSGETPRASGESSGDTFGEASGDDWEIRLAPYIWGASIDGDATVMGNSTKVDASFRDILEKLNGGLFATFEGRKGRFVAVFDLLYVHLEDDFNTGTATVGFGPTTVGRGRLAVAVPRVQTTLGPASVGSETTMWGLEFFGGYRLISRPVSGLFGDADPNDIRQFDLDVFAGGRYWNLDSEVDIEIPPVSVPGFSLSPSLALPGGSVALPQIRVPGVTLGGADVDVDVSQEWVDPLIGMRVEADLSRRFSFSVLGGVGGFGIGSASDLAWNVAASVNVHLGERWEILLGYNAIGIDKDLPSDSNLDLTMHGPVLGFRYRFGPAADQRAERLLAAN
ncbi:MAG: hypothetical protein QNK05_10575 [Myxococcota bacterium]|nr:hypothetical protein [Myxococcota bacterium]